LERRRLPFLVSVRHNIWFSKISSRMPCHIGCTMSSLLNIPFHVQKKLIEYTVSSEIQDDYARTFSHIGPKYHVARLGIKNQRTLLSAFGSHTIIGGHIPKRQTRAGGTSKNHKKIAVARNSEICVPLDLRASFRSCIENLSVVSNPIRLSCLSGICR
jgi:hypothetical protein